MPRLPNEEEGYKCETPPCLHVVVDERRRRFAAFLETEEGDIIYVPSERIEEACRRISGLRAKRLEEARGDEIDEMARKYLNAEPVEGEGDYLEPE